MTIPWFVRAFEKVMAFHDYADRIVAPYKQRGEGARRPLAGEGVGAAGAPDVGHPPAGRALRLPASGQRPRARDDGQ